MLFSEAGYDVVYHYLDLEFIEKLKDSIKRGCGNADLAAKQIHPIWHNNEDLIDLLEALVPGAKFNASPQIGVAIKYPGDPAHAFHNDWTGKKRVGLFVYLQKTTRENGCLRVIAGSHLTESEIWDNHTVCAGPGDVVILDSRVLHGTFPHKGTEPRQMVLCWYEVKR